MSAYCARVSRSQSTKWVSDKPGAEKAQQQRYFGARFIGVDLLNPRLDRLAEAYGARGFYVTRPDEIGDTVATALKSGQPCVVEIPVAEYFPTAAPTPGGASGGH